MAAVVSTALSRPAETSPSELKNSFLIAYPL